MIINFIVFVLNFKGLALISFNFALFIIVEICFYNTNFNTDCRAAALPTALVKQAITVTKSFYKPYKFLQHCIFISNRTP
jgi:hypothetical protein